MRRLVSISALFGFLLSGWAVPASAETGLGGGAWFSPGAAIPAIAGVETVIPTGFFVQNLGSDQAILEFSSTGVEGISTIPLEEGEIALAPGEARDIKFNLVIADFVAPGDYPVVLSIKQVNLPDTVDGQTAYAPAISGSILLQVRGSSATVIIEPVNSDDQSPATGIIVLRFLPESGSSFELANVVGDRLETQVVAGTYEAEFSIPGLVQEKLQFSVESGETKTVKISITGVRFLIAAAKPLRDSGGSVVAAELAVAVRNQLERLPGPIEFKVLISRDGDLVEELTFAQLAELPVGNTEQSTRYTPTAGFTPGVWSFNFVVTGRGFEVQSSPNPSFEIAAGFPWWLLTLLAIVALTIWFVLARRRKHDTENPTRVELGLHQVREFLNAKIAEFRAARR